MVARHPDRFAGYSAVVPMNAPEAAAKEAERALKNGAHAVQLGTNVNGKPIDGKEFWPLYEVIEKSGKPILLHPARSREMIDYQGEEKSKYEICSVLGWPFETGVTLSRFIFSKIMDTYPNLKIVSHHLGGVIPYLEGRIGHSFDQMGARTSDEDYESLRKSLKKRPFDYFKDFYARHRDRGRARADDLRHRLLRRRPCGVRLGLPVRQGEGAGLHPLHHCCAGIARSETGRPREDQLQERPGAVRREVTAAPRSHPCVAGANAGNERGSSMLARTQLGLLEEKSMLQRPAAGTVLGLALCALVCGSAQGQAPSPRRTSPWSFRCRPVAPRTSSAATRGEGNRIARRKGGG